MEIEKLWENETYIQSILKVAHAGITPEQFIVLNQALQGVISMYTVIQADAIFCPIDDMKQENYEREQSLRTVLESAEIIYSQEEIQQTITLDTKTIAYRVKRSEESKPYKKCFYGQCSVQEFQHTSWGKSIQNDLLLGRNVGDVIPVTLSIGNATFEIICIQ